MAVIELVNNFGKWVEESLLKQLHKAPFLSIMAGECTDDVTTTQELAISFPWVERGVPKEYLIKILPLKKAVLKVSILLQ